MPQIRALAVATDISPPASPCGMCRQFIREFCQPSMPIYMYDKKGSYTVKTIGELLPFSFGPNDLKGNDGMKELTSEWKAAGDGQGQAGNSGGAEVGARPAEAAAAAAGDGNEWFVDEHGSLQGRR